MNEQDKRAVDLVAHAVRQFRVDNEERSAWQGIGIAFPHQTTGYNLKLELLPYAGQEIVLMPRTEEQPVAWVHTTRLVLYAVQHVESTQRDYWTRIGVAFPNTKGGFRLKLELLPLIGQNLVLLPPRSNDDASDAAA